MENVIAGANGAPSEGMRQKCQDCLSCQLCSKSRCRCCRGTGEERDSCGLKAGFTYGEYLAWIRNRGK